MCGKRLSIYIIVIIGVILSGCRSEIEKSERIVPPIFTKVVIDHHYQRKSNDYELDTINWEEVEITRQSYDQNSELLIQIYIINPDRADIVSVTINGKDYQDTAFEEGSSVTQINLFVETGSSTGEKEIKIDQIYYKDGSQIRSVELKGNPSLIAYVKKRPPVITDVRYTSEYYEKSQKVNLTLTLNNKDEAEIVSIKINGKRYTELTMNNECSIVTLEIDIGVIDGLDTIIVDDLTFNNLYNIETVSLDYEFDTVI